MVLSGKYSGFGIARSLTVVVLAALTLHVATTTASAASAWSWAKPSITYADNQDLMQESLSDGAANAKVSRTAFIRSLSKLEKWRAAHKGTPQQLPGAVGAELEDVSQDSIFAKAVTLGWITPIGGKFAGSQPITGNEAARGIVGAMGLKPSATKFSSKLRAEIPKLGTNTYLKAAHVYTRVLDMRYNHLAGYEKHEVGPSDAMRMAHVAYMLQRGAQAEGWRLSSFTKYENFNIPALRTNQRTIMRTAVRMLGHPYVWAGETENMQPEGHGGFDCSGFVWRTVLNGGVPASARYPMGARTSMAMSDIPRRKRLARSQLRPGDLLFWGYRGRRSRVSENYHTGVYMGNGWIIHSSGGNGGPTIQKLEGYWADQFSWGRRILRRY